MLEMMTACNTSTLTSRRYWFNFRVVDSKSLCIRIVVTWAKIKIIWLLDSVPLRERFLKDLILFLILTNLTLKFGKKRLLNCTMLTRLVKKVIRETWNGLRTYGWKNGSTLLQVNSEFGAEWHSCYELSGNLSAIFVNNLFKSCKSSLSLTLYKQNPSWEVWFGFSPWLFWWGW